MLQVLLAWLHFSRKPVVPACFSCEGFSNRLSPLWSRTLALGGCRNPIPGQAEQTPKDAGDTAGTGQGDACWSQDWFVFWVSIV